MNILKINGKFMKQGEMVTLGNGVHEYGGRMNIDGKYLHVFRNEKSELHKIQNNGENIQLEPLTDEERNKYMQGNGSFL